MATRVTFVDTIQVQNTGNQLVVINIQPYTDGTFFDKNGGNVNLVVGANVEAEDNRFDIQQLRNLRDKGKITTQNFTRRVEHTTTDATGTDATGS